MELNEYYRDEKVLKKILSSVDNPGWRMWKIEKLDGTFVVNTKKINNIRKLKELVGKDAAKVYVSVSEFMNPERVYGKRIKKSVYKIADNLLLRSDLLFDLDSEDDLRIAHEDGRSIIRWMQEHQPTWKLLNIRFSGSKGFHLLYRDTMPPRVKEPEMRISMFELNKKILLTDMFRDLYLETIDEHHKRIIYDTWRVHAALETIKTKTGYKVQEISLEDFMTKTTSEILQSIERPIKPMIASSSHNVKSPVERTMVSSRFYYNFVTNKIRGSELYVPVLKYPIDIDVDKHIQCIQSRYNLTTLYKFIYQDLQMYVCLKVVDFNRLVKILKASKSLGLSSFLYYRHLWIPFSEAIKETGEVIYKKPEYLENYVNQTKGEISRPHSNLLKDIWDIDFWETNNTQVGRKINNIGLASEAM